MIRATSAVKRLPAATVLDAGKNLPTAVVRKRNKMYGKSGHFCPFLFSLKVRFRKSPITGFFDRIVKKG